MRAARILLLFSAASTLAFATLPASCGATAVAMAGYRTAERSGDFLAAVETALRSRNTEQLQALLHDRYQADRKYFDHFNTIVFRRLANRWTISRRPLEEQLEAIRAAERVFVKDVAQHPVPAAPTVPERYDVAHSVAADESVKMTWGGTHRQMLDFLAGKSGPIAVAASDGFLPRETMEGAENSQYVADEARKLMFDIPAKFLLAREPGKPGTAWLSPELREHMRGISLRKGLGGSDHYAATYADLARAIPTANQTDPIQLSWDGMKTDRPLLGKEGYEALFPKRMHEVLNQVSALGPEKGRIIDFGAGDGRAWQDYFQGRRGLPQARVTLIDVLSSPWWAEQLIQSSGGTAPVRLVRGDVASKNFNMSQVEPGHVGFDAFGPASYAQAVDVVVEREINIFSKFGGSLFLATDSTATAIHTKDGVLTLTEWIAKEAKKTTGIEVVTLKEDPLYGPSDVEIRIQPGAVFKTSKLKLVHNSHGTPFKRIYVED